MTDLTDIYALSLAWHDEGRRIALATVIETWGSAPHAVGSLMLVDADGDVAGSVSGGCVEGAVIIEAIAALDDGQARVLSYGVSDDDAFAVGLACGGRIRVMVEPVGTTLPVDMLRTLVTAKAARKPIGYVVDLHGQGRRIVDGSDYPEQFRLGRSGVLADGVTFVSVHSPPKRLVVVGAVHIAQALVPVARACGYDVVVVDPRSAFATKARFPQAELMVDWPDAALAQIGLDSRTAVVTLSHDPKLDDPALMVALSKDVFYLGALGSTRTHAKRMERLTLAGIAPDQITRIHAPVGLNLGGSDPAEIAVSIIAQMTQVLRQM
tara:strand:- start:12703 stop:13671 length:969 start_codon:yes stop_codon:yes gene_type:complete